MLDPNLIIAIIGALAALAAYWQAKASKTRSEENAISLKEVKHSVNSERTAMLAELSEHKEEIAKFREIVARLTEKQVAIEKADAVKEAINKP